MPLTPPELLARLEAFGLPASTIEHAPAFTVAEGEAAMGQLPGVLIKNLFLRDPKEAMWLVVAPWDRKIDLKRLPAAIGSGRLSFGSPDRLMRVLGVTPGSVTPFAVINDAGNAVKVILDAWMMTQPVINAHPLINSMTTSIASNDLMTFLAACHHPPRLLDLEKV